MLFPIAEQQTIMTAPFVFARHSMLGAEHAISHAVRLRALKITFQIPLLFERETRLSHLSATNTII